MKLRSGTPIRSLDITTGLMFFATQAILNPDFKIIFLGSIIWYLHYVLARSALFSAFMEIGLVQPVY